MGNHRSLTAALDHYRSRIPDAADRAFVQFLAYGVLRCYWSLNGVLDQLVQKPIKDLDIKMLALLGLYQLKFTRVKKHAAVTETVAAAREKPWAKPFLNAILRAYERGKDDVETHLKRNLCVDYDHPAWLIAALQEDWPACWERLLRENNQPPPMGLRVNRLRCDRDKYMACLEQSGLKADFAPVGEAGLVLASPVAVDALPQFSNGWVSVQDIAGQLTAPLLELQPGMRVLDACAGPGGKTSHVLETCPDIKELVAVEIAEERAEKIRENLRRLGLDCSIVVADVTAISKWWCGAPYDRILVDVPCSGTGVIRRHPDIKLLREPGDVAGLIERQQRILRSVWRVLKPGGILVYTTCSVLRTENEGQIDDFLGTHPDAEEIPVNAPWGLPVSHGRQILTGEQGMDGFYFARIKKKEEPL